MTQPNKPEVKASGLKYLNNKYFSWVKRHPRKSSFLLLVFIAGIAFWRCLPLSLFEDNYSSILLSQNDELLGARIATDGQWRFPHSRVVADKFKQAIISFEDKRFYSHPGVDPIALLRAIYLNITQGRVVSGASTLSMQVIRLSRKNPERTYYEKLIEIILAIRLELRHSKEDILALYASHAPFGGNVVGVETAAWRYFGRSTTNLSWAESATLAVLPNNPAMIHPGRNRNVLKTKRDALLEQLHKVKIIDAIELKLAKLEPLPSKPVALPRYAPHLLDSVLLDSKKSIGKSSEYRFKSTIDKSVQLAVNDIVQQQSHSLSLQNIHNAAAIVIDNDNFNVVAYVGNSNRYDKNKRGYAIDIIRRPRSTGSILKPFLFATMIQQGEILSKTLIADLPTQYSGYMPENFDRLYRGAVPAHTALARSLNVPAVRMLKQHGVERFYDFLKNMGMSSLHRNASDYGLTLILGGAEGTLKDLAMMYANLAHIAKQDRVDSRVRYKKLKILRQPEIKQGNYTEINPATAWMTLDALLEVNRPGNENFWKNFSSSQKIAWKTGTSYGLRDAWAIGNTRKYTVAVWIGNASGEGRPGLTGSSTAAPVMFEIFNKLEGASWFEKPLELMRPVKVCKDDGYLANDYCDAEIQWIPKESNFDQVTRYHKKIHLDMSQTWQVHSRCESVSKMIHKNWFILPPGLEFYYKKNHSSYRSLPPYRKDCKVHSLKQGQNSPIELLYPQHDTRIYIPVDLAEKKSRTVFEAVHREYETTLYWHLDDEYIGSTQTFHQQALDITPGKHRITIVDSQGNRLVRKFEVLSKE
mgnify:CR=1 FL=1